MVALLVIFESAHTWMTCHTIYHYSILSYSNPLSLIDGEWSVYTANALGIPIVFLIQIYFARMVYLLAAKAWRLVVVITFSILIVAQIAFGIYASVDMFVIWDLPSLKKMVHPALVPLYCIRLVSDAITATALCVVLYDATSRSIFRGSNRLFKTLIVYAMERFILTTVVVIVQTIVLIAKPTSIWAMVLDFVTVHLYVNSLLATLNARQKLRTMGPESNIGNDESTPKFFTEPSRGESNRPTQVDIYISRKHEGSRVDQDTEDDAYTMSKLGDGRTSENTQIEV